MPNWEKIRDNYLDKMKRGRTESSIRSIKNRINMLLRYFGNKEIVQEDYDKFLIWAFENYAHTTVHRAHKEIKRFLKSINHKVYKEIEFLRIPEKLPRIKVLTKNQLQTVIDWCLLQTGVNWRKRCAIYLLILATSGMRAGEAVRLKWSNWDPGTHTFHLEDTKTGVSRIAAYSPQITPHLTQWRQECTLKHGSPSIWVIPSLYYPLQHANYTAIQIKLNTRLKNEFDFHFTSKMFRSTLVQRIIDNGGGYEDAAAVVGHKDIGVTQKHYARIKLNNKAITSHQRALRDLDL